jgi:putative chitinase
MASFDRDIYFDTVRLKPFGGKLNQEQVDGQNFILDAWESNPPSKDLRHLAYCLATTIHETASTMLPIEEYGKGKGQPYGVPDPETKQVYYGRGFVQLTWRENYARASHELDLDGANDLEWHADKALDPTIAANVMFIGMTEGWFRGDKNGRHTLARYFNINTNDNYRAREIINGDKHIVPNWSHGVSIGNLIAGYHDDFLAALEASVIESGAEAGEPLVVTVRISVPPGVIVRVEQTKEEPQ